MPGDIDEDDYKIVDDVHVFSSFDGAFKQYKEYCGDLSEEVAEDDLYDSLKDDYMQYALTHSGKSLKVWIETQNVIE